MMRYKLSICIPTYNRGEFLNEALASIAAQEAIENIEIVISDNASTDNTADLVEHWKKVLPGIKYFRWESNQGADANFLKVIEIASGEYCWLLGSDDKLAENAISDILPFLNNTSILLVDYDLMSLDMNSTIQKRKTLACSPGSQFTLQSATDFKEYLAVAHELSSLFAYISTLIVRKEDWDAISTRTEFIGSAWIHVTKALEMFARGNKLTYVGKTMILNRSGNDSFLEEVGFVRRMLIDLDYIRICDQIFSESPEFRLVMKAWLEVRFFGWKQVLGARYLSLRADQGTSLEKVKTALFQRFERTLSWKLKLLAWNIFPQSILHWLRVRQRIRQGRSLN